MDILVVGSQAQLDEAAQKFDSGNRLIHVSRPQDVREALPSGAVVFDFSGESEGERMKCYEGSPAVFLNASFRNLAKLTSGARGTWFGFCGLPTFLNREILEVTVQREEDKKHLKEICASLGTKVEAIKDHVGLVTPRVICMIINEAYYTVEEGTATREDIDLAMKLGTNYPWGPFEWCNRIGVANVRNLLDAVYADTGDERYKISPLLVREADAVKR